MNGYASERGRWFMAWRTLHRICGMMLIALVFVAGIRSGMFLTGMSMGSEQDLGCFSLMMATKRHDGIQGRGIPGTGTILGLVNLDKGLRVVLGCICGMILMYVLHGIGRPLSLEGTMKEIILWGSYASFTAVAWRISRTGDGLRLMQIGWHLLGAVLCGGALLAVYGLLGAVWDLSYGGCGHQRVRREAWRPASVPEHIRGRDGRLPAGAAVRAPPVLRSRTGTLRAAPCRWPPLLPRAPDGVARRLARGRTRVRGRLR